MDSLYCNYVKAIEKIPQEALNANKKEVDELFRDVNEQIQAYDRQYNILLQELGVLCNVNKQDKIEYFFKTINDLLQLGIQTYVNDSKKQEVFQTVVKHLTSFLNGNGKNENALEQAQPLEKALLVQITKSAWLVTNPQRDMNKVAQQIGGSQKNKTRKAKRT